MDHQLSKTNKTSSKLDKLFDELIFILTFFFDMIGSFE